RPTGKIVALLTSHDANRTGAPIALLGLLAELSQRSEFECWVLLNRGGALEAKFASYAPTLNLGRLLRYGASRQSILGMVAVLFGQYAIRGFALCNTIATPDLNATLARYGVSVVSWIHELPESIDAFYGGEATFKTILEASKVFICPSEFARQALLHRYRPVQPEKFQVIYYGVAQQRRAQSREQVRSSVLEELGIPPDATVVLGCGTVDRRKGVDLFVRVASRLLTTSAAENFWFVWVGDAYDSRFLSSCRHDARTLGVANRLVFTGERNDVERFFAAADIFSLTSREDPYPLVNLEAMAAGLAIVAFEDAGGAQEVLKDGRGVLVPHLDVEKF